MAGCFHAELHVLIGGSLKAGRNDLEDTGCTQNWTVKVWQNILQYFTDEK